MVNQPIDRRRVLARFPRKTNITRKVQAVLRQDQLPDTQAFDVLYQHIAALTRNIKGIGPLFVYDAALRVGANRRAYPKRVYIHAGVRKGAAVLLGSIPAAVHARGSLLLSRVGPLWKLKTFSVTLPRPWRV